MISDSYRKTVEKMKHIKPNINTITEFKDKVRWSDINFIIISIIIIS